MLSGELPLPEDEADANEIVKQPPGHQEEPKSDPRPPLARLPPQGPDKDRPADL